MTTEPPHLSVADLADGAGTFTLAPDGTPRHPVAVVDLRQAAPSTVLRAATVAAGCATVLVGLATGEPGPDLRPVLARLAVTMVPNGTADPRCVRAADPDETVAVLGAAVCAAPRAALTLVRLLPLTETLPVRDGLVAESLAYSMLLAGPEFLAWRARTPRQVAAGQEGGDPVLVTRRGAVLTVALNRPGRHNAFGVAIRDGLVAALEIAAADPGLRVELTGRGPSFCSGGDLAEFGTAPDVATAHLVRSYRNAGASVHACADRVRAVVHGACIGAGIEIPAFAGCLLARHGAWFQLPELRMGLIPGAGGTVSVTRRIGRWRTGFLALSGQRVDVPTALRWGLVDGSAD
jgi:hypothetical protein